MSWLSWDGLHMFCLPESNGSQKPLTGPGDFNSGIDHFPNLISSSRLLNHAINLAGRSLTGAEKFLERNFGARRKPQGWSS